MMSLLSSLPDSVLVYADGSGDFGRNEGISVEGNAKSCLLQTLSATERREYSAVGMSATHIVFFTSDPSITNGKWLKVTRANGEILWVRAMSVEFETNPGGTIVLWSVVCEAKSSVGTPEVS